MNFNFLSYFFPKSCLFCQTPGETLCNNCKAKILLIKKEHCDICGIPFVSSPIKHVCGNCLKKKPFYDKHRSLFVFDENSKKIIYGLKYHAKFWIKDLLATYIANTIQDFKPSVDCIVPIPLHKNRLKKRGFNQSLVIAKQCQKHLQKPILQKHLVRKSETPSQTGLNKKRRQENLKNVFEIHQPASMYNKTILLIDDVHTTGVTLNEAAKELKKVGAKQVFAFTLAITA